MAASAAGNDTRTGQAVLSAAAALFAERGYHATRIRDIAHAAGLSKASIYHYVRSKEELLYALASRTLEDHLLAATEVTLSHEEPVEALRELIRAHLRGLLAKRTSIAFTLLDAKSLPPDQFRAIAALRDRYAEIVRGVIASCRQDGAIRGDLAARELSIALSNILNGTLFWYRPRLDLDAVAEVTTSVFLHGLNPAAPALPRNRRIEAAPVGASVEFEMPADLHHELQRSTAARSAAILDVALRSFHRGGYLGTTTRDLARDAGLGNGTLYHHVADKEELLFLICLQVLHDTAGHAAPTARLDATAADRLLRFIEQHATSVLGDVRRSAVALTEARHLSGLRREQIADLSERYLGLLAGILANGQRSGEVRRDVDPSTLARLVLSALNWSALWYRDGGAWQPIEIARFLYQVLYRGAAAASLSQSG